MRTEQNCAKKNIQLQSMSDAIICIDKWFALQSRTLVYSVWEQSDNDNSENQKLV